MTIIMAERSRLVSDCEILNFRMSSEESSAMEFTDDQIYEIILPLISKRSELRQLLGHKLIESLSIEHAGDPIASKRVRTKTSNKPPPSPAFALFSKVRRLVIVAARPNAKDSEVERQLEDEWAKLGPGEVAKWEELAGANSNQEEPLHY